MGFLTYTTLNIANFEAFRWNISLNANFLFLKGDTRDFFHINFPHILLYFSDGTKRLHARALPHVAYLVLTTTIVSSEVVGAL